MESLVFSSQSKFLFHTQTILHCSKKTKNKKNNTLKGGGSFKIKQVTHKEENMKWDAQAFSLVA